VDPPGTLVLWLRSESGAEIPEREIGQGRTRVAFAAFFKIPLRALILLTGVLMFVFFLLMGPLLFNRAPLDRVRAGARR
jgi:hypothetical protein